jgi:hypothetical protein
MAHQDDKPCLPEAVSRLVELGLTLNADQDREKRRALKMARDAVDRLGDTTTTAGDRQLASGGLLDGPEEFDCVRIDRPKHSKSMQK